MLRRTARASAALIVSGAAALTLGSCGLIPGGGSEPGETTAETVEETAAEETPAETAEEVPEEAATAETPPEETAGEPTGSEAAGATTFTPEELEGGKQTAVDFFHAMGDQDFETACSLMTDFADPSVPMTEANTGTCAAVMGPTMEQQLGSSPDQLDALTLVSPGMLEIEDHGDGTAAVSIPGPGQPLPVVNIDGSWYIDLAGMPAA